MQLNGGTDVQLCTQDYTVKDELKTKYLGGNAAAHLQKNDYDYLPNGFLSKINHGSGYESSDLFQLELRYDQNVDLGTAQYNGNIAQLIWQVPGEDAQAFGFTYDYLDRLTTSTYGAYPGGTLSVTDRYNSTYTYDDRGNILTLDRWGLQPDGAGGFASGQILGRAEANDALTFAPPSASNRLESITDQATAPLATSGFNDHGQSGAYAHDVKLYPCCS